MVNPNQLIKDIFGFSNTLIKDNPKKNIRLKPSNNLYVLYDKDKIVYICNSTDLTPTTITYQTIEVYNIKIDLMVDCVKSLLIKYYKPKYNKRNIKH